MFNVSKKHAFSFGQVIPVTPTPALLFDMFCKKKNLWSWILVKTEEQSCYILISLQQY